VWSLNPKEDAELESNLLEVTRDEVKLHESYTTNVVRAIELGMINCTGHAVPRQDDR
jgi:hypothetical protein